jgi:deoxycytidylate deaminase
MRKVDEKFIAMAAQEALRGEFSRYQHGAVIARNKDVISTGYNRNIGIDNRLTALGHFYSLHAELEAIRKMPYSFKDACTLYSIRHNFNMARPCPKCLKVIAKTPIKRIVFSVSPGYFAEIFL